MVASSGVASDPVSPQAPRVLPPDRWEGETDCRVGPFRDLHSAEGFANALVDFGRYETLCEQVVIDDEGVYVEVRSVCS